MEKEKTEGQSVDVKEGCLRCEWVFLLPGLMRPQLDPGVMVMGRTVDGGDDPCGERAKNKEAFLNSPTVHRPSKKKITTAPGAHLRRSLSSVGRLSPSARSGALETQRTRRPPRAALAERRPLRSSRKEQIHPSRPRGRVPAKQRG